MSTPFMQLYVADYLGDTRHLTTEQHGAYLLLLMAMWRADGVLPDDDAKLARVAGLTVARWRRIKGDVLDFFTSVEGGITQARLAAELAIANEKSEKRSRSGKAGARAKALKNNKQGQANAERSLKHSPEPDNTLPNGRDAGPSPDLDKRAWDEALVTLQRGGLNGPKARAFFGKLLKDHKLSARDLLPSLLNAQVAGTADPQAYLVKAASGVSQRRGTGAPVSVPIADWTDDRWAGAVALWRDEGWWSNDLGPPPGQPGCRVPPALLIEPKQAA